MHGLAAERDACRDLGAGVYTGSHPLSLDIRSQEVNRLADKLATMAGVSKTEAIRPVLAAEIARRGDAMRLRERVTPIRDAIAAFPRIGLEAGETSARDRSKPASNSTDLHR